MAGVIRRCASPPHEFQHRVPNQEEHLAAEAVELRSGLNHERISIELRVQIDPVGEVVDAVVRAVPERRIVFFPLMLQSYIPDMINEKRRTVAAGYALLPQRVRDMEGLGVGYDLAAHIHNDD